MTLDFSRLMVRPHDVVSATKWNSLVQWLSAVSRETGAGLYRSPTGRPSLSQLPSASSGGVSAQWCIVREIADDADLTVRIEQAVRGPSFANAEEPLDFGRYIGAHEAMRLGDVPPDPIPPFEDYLTDVSLWPHTTAVDWRYFLWPHTADPGDPLYRDTHVEDTDICMAIKPADNWVLIPVYRDQNGDVAESARQFDCIVEV